MFPYVQRKDLIRNDNGRSFWDRLFHLMWGPASLTKEDAATSAGGLKSLPYGLVTGLGLPFLLPVPSHAGPSGRLGPTSRLSKGTAKVFPAAENSGLLFGGNVL